MKRICSILSVVLTLSCFYNWASATEPIEVSAYCEIDVECEDFLDDLYVGPDGTAYDEDGEPVEDPEDELDLFLDGL